MVKNTSRQGSRKDMLETGRRSAISTSELGLYSERVDRLTRSRYGLVVRKFAIGIMVVVAVILVIVFLYDFSSATAHSKVNQETKHIYILQNALKKPTNFSRKFSQSSGSSEGNLSRPDLMPLEDRSDNLNYGQPLQLDETMDTSDNPESRAQNLHNYKLRKRVLKSISNDRDQAPEAKQLFDNHAVVYRVRQRHKYPDFEEESSSDESRPTPFHWEYRTPHPASFKRPKYPQLTQYRYPQNSRNIQDIIKYLTHDAELPGRGIKFAGVYVNPKKYDMIPELGEMMSNSDRSSEEFRHAFQVPINEDPFYQYKPKHPADVNLLATSNVRFSPTGLHRYNPFYDQYYARPVLNYNKQPLLEPQYESSGSYVSPNLAAKRKPKPFSVMLDIYPITDIVEQQNKKSTRPRPPQLVPEDFETRRPFQYGKGLKYFAPSPQTMPAVGVPSQMAHMDEDERQQMVFHLNLYPRKKNRMSRHEILHKSANMAPEERLEFAEKIMTPLETIAKHLTDHSTIEEFKYEEDDTPKPTSMPITRYQETNLPNDDEKELNLPSESENPLPHSEKLFADLRENNVKEENTTIPINHKVIVDDDYASTEKYEAEGQKMTTTGTTTEKEILEYKDTVITEEPKIEETTTTTFQVPKDIDTIEGFQRFNDGLVAMP